MSDATPAKSTSWFIVAAVLGCCAIFAVVLAIAYLPKRPTELSEGVKSPEDRANLLKEHRARESSVLSDYGWIDQSKGVVRLPIDRAMELTIQEINAKK